MNTIEERAIEYQKIEDFVTDEYLQRTDRLIGTFPPNDYVNRNPYAKDSFRVGYTFGATEQDTISRADQKKIDVEKACEWLSKNYICFNGTKFNQMMIDKFKEAMEE